MAQPQAKSAPLKGPVLQRKCACGQHASGGECEECRKKKQTLRRRKGNLPEPDSVPPIVYEILRSPGQPLEASVRGFMESRLGHDFSRVRVHMDSTAAMSTRALNALAYTVGQNIVFGAGQYSPQTHEGRGLMAHELTHVMQQDGNDEIPNNLTIGHPGSDLELEADRMAVAVVAGSVPMKGDPQTSAPSIIRDALPMFSRRTKNSLKSLNISPKAIIQRQLFTPQAAGGGFGGLLDRGGISSVTPNTQVEPRPKKIKVWVNSFIPDARIDGPPGSECFAGDNRSFSDNPLASSRTHQEVEFNVDTSEKISDIRRIGTSHEVSCSTGVIIGTGTAPLDELDKGRVAKSGRLTYVSFSASATNPLVTIAPSIDINLLFEIDPFARQCSLKGFRDQYPAYEGYIKADGNSPAFVFGYDPRRNNEGPIGLFFSQYISVSKVRF